MISQQLNNITIRDALKNKNSPWRKIPISTWDVSNVTDFNYLFYGTIYNIDDINIEKWNVSSVTNMSFCFYWCKKFNSSLSKWNVSSVEDMSYMFCGCYCFNQSLDKWNVSSVKNMEGMFFSCTSFNNSSILSWKLKSIENVNLMFCNCYSLNQPLSSFNMNHTIQNKNMFANCILMKPYNFPNFFINNQQKQFNYFDYLYYFCCCQKYPG